MASHVPAVCANAGGLPNLCKDGQTGLYSGNATLDASDLLERKARCLEVTPARRIEEAVLDYERGWYELRASWVAHIMFDFEHLPLPMEYDSHYKIAIYVANSTCQEQRCTPSRERLRVPRRQQCKVRQDDPACHDYQTGEELLVYPCSQPIDLSPWFLSPDVDIHGSFAKTLLPTAHALKSKACAPPCAP